MTLGLASSPKAAVLVGWGLARDRAEGEDRPFELNTYKERYRVFATHTLILG